MEYDIVAPVTIFIRLSAAVMWTVVVARYLLNDNGVPRLVRQLVGSVVVFGMWTLFLGGLSLVGLPLEYVRPMYTAFTVYAGLMALAILTAGDFR